jgi:hypothetical protein
MCVCLNFNYLVYEWCGCPYWKLCRTYIKLFWIILILVRLNSYLVCILIFLFYRVFETMEDRLLWIIAISSIQLVNHKSYYTDMHWAGPMMFICWFQIKVHNMTGCLLFLSKLWMLSRQTGMKHSLVMQT